MREMDVREMEEKQPYVECLCQCFEEVRTGSKRIPHTVTNRSATRRSSWKTKKNPVAIPPGVDVSGLVLTKKRKAARWLKAVRAPSSFL